MVGDLYLCDPNKNIECRKTCCYEHNLNPLNGKCMYTRDKRFSKDGKTYFYNEKTMEIERKK